MERSFSERSANEAPKTSLAIGYPASRGSFTGRSQVMFDPPTMARPALDQTPGGEPVGERPERLITLEGLNGQYVGGGTRTLVDNTQSIPLGERRSHRCKPGIECSVMLILHLLNDPTQRYQVNSHIDSLPLQLNLCISIC